MRFQLYRRNHSLNNNQESVSKFFQEKKAAKIASKNNWRNYFTWNNPESLCRKFPVHSDSADSLRTCENAGICNIIFKKFRYRVKLVFKHIGKVQTNNSNIDGIIKVVKVRSWPMNFTRKKCTLGKKTNNPDFAQIISCRIEI